MHKGFQSAARQFAAVDWHTDRRLITADHSMTRQWKTALFEMLWKMQIRCQPGGLLLQQNTHSQLQLTKGLEGRVSLYQGRANYRPGHKKSNTNTTNKQTKNNQTCLYCKSLLKLLLNTTGLDKNASAHFAVTIRISVDLLTYCRLLCVNNTPWTYCCFSPSVKTEPTVVHQPKYYPPPHPGGRITTVGATTGIKSLATSKT